MRFSLLTMISGAPEVQQPLQAVVAVDHPAVQVVEVGGGEAATVELHHRAQLRRDHRHHVEDHGLRGSLIRRPFSSRWLNEATILRRLMAFCLRCADRGLRPSSGVDGGAELLLFLIEVEAVDELLDRVGAHAALEVLAVAVAQLTPQHLVFDDLTGEEARNSSQDRCEQVELQFP
jgi:hypothetical protein